MVSAYACVGGAVCRRRRANRGGGHGRADPGIRLVDDVLCDRARGQEPDGIARLVPADASRHNRTRTVRRLAPTGPMPLPRIGASLRYRAGSEPVAVHTPAFYA